VIEVSLWYYMYSKYTSL